MRSVARALEVSGATAIVTEEYRELERAHAVVLPGDGAALSGMRGLAQRDLIGAIRDFVASGRPFLGVCLGMQVLMSYSDEDGGVECLGIVAGRVRRLPDGLKVPHMGWNQVHQAARHRIFDDVPDGTNFYFLHSYVVVPDDPSVTIGTTDYGGSFTSAIAARNVVATQFHPEKSATFGLHLYRNFIQWARDPTPRAAVAAGEHL